MASPTLTTTAIPAQLNAKKSSSNQNSNIFTTLLLLIFVSVIVRIVRSLLHFPSHSTLKYKESFCRAGQTMGCSLAEMMRRDVDRNELLLANFDAYVSIISQI